ncbi:MAG: hypothetical protein HRT61_00300 [Ekhidna sp.]|jgi:hypothetical protein|nr:hypothetical protein [Ekhidna sp.]
MEGLIRKITIGDNPKDAMAYVVGNNVGADYLIDSILFEEELLRSHNISRYNIYVKEKRNGGYKLWKTVEGVPTVIEYDLDF